MTAMGNKREPLIIIVSAPSGSGKTTIINRLIADEDNIKRTVSYTTRQAREGEQDKEDYIFVSEEEFKEKMDRGDFLEWEENFGCYYGTSAEQVREALAGGTDIILSIDVKGARTVKKRLPESISIFIMPPSPEELEARLKKRNTDGEKEVFVRLQESQREMESSEEYDYLIVNKDFEEALKELKAIVGEERNTRKKNREKEGKAC